MPAARRASTVTTSAEQLITPISLRRIEATSARCSGCHTLSVVGAEGSATSIQNRLRTNGPNFNFRKESTEQVLYAIRNGGFSGAVMPENIVVGEDAEAIASFLEQYSGHEAQKVPSTNITLSTK